MKTTFLNLRTRSILRKKKTDRHSTPFDVAESIGILYTAEDQSKLDAVNAFTASLRSEGKQVFLLEFQPAKKDIVCSDAPSISQKQIGFWGTIESGDAKAFLKQPFDYLFLADLEPGPLSKHILAATPTRCRVGKHSSGVEEYLDLMVEMNGPWPLLLETMLLFVRKLS
ncbi:MAG: DUF6913 domain-containing protein [Bacteroidota bacterium]